MTTIKEISSRFIYENESKIILDENIIFIDFSLKNNSLLLLSSNNTFYICEMNNNAIIIKNKFERIIDKNIKINKCYFCNENPNLILLLCDNFNILEWNVEREYISHIYYDVLGDNYEIKMNCQKRLNFENSIQNLCILKDGEINVWNTMQYNKKNVLNAKDIKCFSYDSTGLLLYFVEKLNQKYSIKAFKFIDEYECKELYIKILSCFDSKVNIGYLNIFDVNIIMSDTSSRKIYIFKNHPINKIEFDISINKSELCFSLDDKNPLFGFKILCLNIKEDEQKLITFNYNPKEHNIKKIKLSISNLYYFKERINEKGLLLVFDNIKKELKQYEI